MKIFVFDFTDKILPKEPYTQTMAYREEMDAVEMAVKAFLNDLAAVACSTKCEFGSMDGYYFWYIDGPHTEITWSFTKEDHVEYNKDRLGYPKKFLQKFNTNATLMFAKLYSKQTEIIGFDQYEKWIKNNQPHLWDDIPLEFTKQMAYEAPLIENLSIIGLR